MPLLFPLRRLLPRDRRARIVPSKDIPPAILREEEAPETWADRIQRVVLVNQWLAKPVFRMILPRLRTIPSLPESHRLVVEALRDPQFELQRVARLVTQDVGLTTHLLKVVNSAALGLAHPIHSIPDAIALVGATRLQSLVMSAWAFSFADEKMCRGFSPAAEWQHALAVAQAAEDYWPTAPRQTRPHRVRLHHRPSARRRQSHAGRQFPEAYAGILALAKKLNQPLWQTETRVLGFSHAEVGACLLGLWGLDVPIVLAVAAHHQAELALSNEVSPAKLVFEANFQFPHHRHRAAQSKINPPRQAPPPSPRVKLRALECGGLPPLCKADRASRTPKPAALLRIIILILMPPLSPRVKLGENLEEFRHRVLLLFPHRQHVLMHQRPDSESPPARLVMHEMAATASPHCRATIASGTVLIPTASAPSRRNARISAGVS